MKTVAEVIQQLRTSKCRITRTREALIEILYTAGQPQSVPELLARLAKRNLRVNKTTAYRELDFLIKQKLVREIDLLEGLKRYEPIAHDCHHHLVCLKCQKIQCFTLAHESLHPIQHNIAESFGFQVQQHTLEFFGLCKACGGGKASRLKVACC